jgi:hypothetical protein
MTPEWNFKRARRALRTVPVDAIAPVIAATESAGDGLWCMVAGELSFVPSHGGGTETIWDDALEYAQFVRWVEAHPERIYDTHEAAVAFVRSRITPPPEPPSAHH